MIVQWLEYLQFRRQKPDLSRRHFRHQKLDLSRRQKLDLSRRQKPDFWRTIFFHDFRYFEWRPSDDFDERFLTNFEWRTFFHDIWSALLWEVEWRVFFLWRRPGNTEAGILSANFGRVYPYIRYLCVDRCRQALLASPYFALHCLVPLSATVAIEISYDFASFTALLASLCASLWRDSSLEQFCHHVW